MNYSLSNESTFNHFLLRNDYLIQDTQCVRENVRLYNRVGLVTCTYQIGNYLGLYG